MRLRRTRGWDFIWAEAEAEAEARDDASGGERGNVFHQNIIINHGLLRGSRNGPVPKQDMEQSSLSQLRPTPASS
tara:strand:+ start:240 stop:464 length:225 start_codon:yes stop_codon:yes gene_type:complete